MVEPTAARNPLSLSEPEKDELIAEYRAELELQLERRRQAESQNRRGSEERRESAKETEKARLKREVARRFWEENGYRLYTDSRGNTMWMSADAYDRRMKSRKRRNRGHDAMVKRGDRLKKYYTAGAVVLLAVLLGLALAS